MLNNSCQTVKCEPLICTLHAPLGLMSSRLNTCAFTILTFKFSLQTEPVFKHTCYIVVLTCTLLSYFKLYIPTEEESLNRMGMTCVVITVIMFGSPLVVLVSMCKILDNLSKTCII